MLGAITGTLERFPGLLVLVPAAVGLRGNIFSTFGARLATALHTGEFELSLRRGTVLRQNVDASMVLTLLMSTVLAGIAFGLGSVFDVGRLSSPLQLALISVVGGTVASLVVLTASVALAAAAVQWRLDLDNVVAPVVSTLGDVVTLPSLWLATFVADVPVLSPVLSIGLIVVSLGAFVAALRSDRRILRRVTVESWPVLTAAAVLSTLAGVVLEQRLAVLAAVPALLTLQPAFVSSAGALGGILSSRTASRLHIGLTTPEWLPDPNARGDVVTALGLALPVALLNGTGAYLVATGVGHDSPALAAMLMIAVAGGAVTVAFALAIAYVSTVAAYRVGVDPDTYGIPVVTAAVDFVGVAALIATAVAVGFLR